MLGGCGTGRCHCMPGPDRRSTCLHVRSALHVHAHAHGACACPHLAPGPCPSPCLLSCAGQHGFSSQLESLSRCAVLRCEDQGTVPAGREPHARQTRQQQQSAPAAPSLKHKPYNSSTAGSLAPYRQSFSCCCCCSANLHLGWAGQGQTCHGLRICGPGPGPGPGPVPWGARPPCQQSCRSHGGTAGGC